MLYIGYANDEEHVEIIGIVYSVKWKCPNVFTVKTANYLNKPPSISLVFDVNKSVFNLEKWRYETE